MKLMCKSLALGSNTLCAPKANETPKRKAGSAVRVDRADVRSAHHTARLPRHLNRELRVRHIIPPAQSSINITYGIVVRTRTLVFIERWKSPLSPHHVGSASLTRLKATRDRRSMQAPSSLRGGLKSAIGRHTRTRFITLARPPPSPRPRRCPCPTQRRCPCPSPRGSAGYLVRRDRLRASRPAPLDAIISTVVISGHQRSSVVISGHQ